MNSAIINLEVYGGGINKYLFANSEAGRLDTFGIQIIRRSFTLKCKPAVDLSLGQS